MDADDRFDSSRNPTTQAGPRSIVRRLAGHWRLMLLLWLVLATPVAYLIYNLLEPTYEAFSLLQVQPTQKNLFVPGLNDGMDRVIAQPYLETQVQLIGSDRVLDAAIARPATTTTPLIAKLPMIATSKDPKADLRKDIVIEIVKNTFLIRVALASRDPDEAAAIVNAVVDAYLEQHGEYHRSANKLLKKSLEEEHDMLVEKVAQKRTELRALIAKGHVEVTRNVVSSNVAKEDAAGIQPALNAVTEEQYVKLTDRLVQADLDLIDAQARLETARLAKAPASAEKLAEREAAVEEAKRKRLGYVRYIERLEVLARARNSDTLDTTLANQELAGLLKMQDIIVQKLEELRFESKQDVYRVTRHDEAQVPKAPVTNQRIIYMPAASVGILFLIVGLFLVREIQTSFVSDPEESETSAGPSA